MTAPDNLRTRIQATLTPVRPISSPGTSTLWLVPLAWLVVLAVPSLHWFRHDLESLGWFRAWALSALEAAAGLAVIRLALREAIPGRSVSLALLWGLFLLGFTLPFITLALTTSSFTVGPGAGRWLHDAMICFRASAGAAVPALIVPAFFVARGFPLRPGVAGALYGLGSGIVADAGLRLFCDYSTPSHVVSAHGGAILASAAIGTLLARLIPRS